MTATANTESMPRMGEQRLLNLICLICAVGLFAFIAYNLLSAGSIISTDGLFFTVVPLVIALSFLAVPLQEILGRRLEKRRIARGEEVSPSGSSAKVPAAVGGASTAGAIRSAPALKDSKGRAMPPDVNRMVAEMKKAEGSKQ